MTRIALACLATLIAAVAVAADFELTKEEDGVTVKHDGKLVTRYVFLSKSKPIMWPVVGPGGKELTRGYPMRAALETEKADHPHHRSFWFDHGDVNGVSFWDENDKKPYGSIIHKELVTAEGGKQAVIVTRNDWKMPDGSIVVSDKRTHTFGLAGESRWIDVDVVVTAVADTVTFGATKEGSFGVRVAGPLSVDSKVGGKIVTSEGLTDAAAWGKRAKWVDYFGPLEGETMGIAILNHPSSFRHPTPWHVRTYGLFAANPFGLKDFGITGEGDGSHGMKKGETMILRHRVVLHRGDEKQAKIADIYADYAKTPKGEEGGKR